MTRLFAASVWNVGTCSHHGSINCFGGTAVLGNTCALRQVLGIFPCRVGAGLTGCNEIYDRRLNECVSITAARLPKIAVSLLSPLSVNCVLRRSGQQQIKQHTKLIMTCLRQWGLNTGPTQGIWIADAVPGWYKVGFGPALFLSPHPLHSQQPVQLSCLIIDLEEVLLHFYQDVCHQ